MNKIIVSAPGKLMLLGEHAVLYNYPCLVTAINKRLYVTVEILNTPQFQLEAADVGLKRYEKPINKLGKGNIPKGAKFVEIAVRNLLSHPEQVLGSRAKGRFRNKFGMTKEMGIRVTTKSDLSSQFGFGSSSASTACTIKGLSELLILNLTNKEIFELSYKTVLDIQGKGSGFDVAAAVYGGTLYFLTGGKAIEFIDVKELQLIVAYSGIKADTVSLINKVKKSFANKQNRLNEVYNAIEVLVNKASDALIKMDWQTLGKLMNKNQEYLKELGVSTDKLDSIINAAIIAGAYGAKLSGAGGGDCMIAIVSKDKEESVKKGIINAGGEIINVKTNVEGVRIEK